MPTKYIVAEVKVVRLFSSLLTFMAIKFKIVHTQDSSYMEHLMYNHTTSTCTLL